MNYRPAFQLKDETKFNGTKWPTFKWTSWNELYCASFNKSGYGKWYWTVWSWGNGWHFQRQPNCGADECDPFIESKGAWPNNSFPELEDIAAATCREYASCQKYEKDDLR